ncbi:centrosomal protein of 104 kDa isoform 2-T2 [Pholidichthys leucotaenia]
MSRKIGFTVIDSSSHEDNFSAKELMVHGPTVSGWRSSRMCPYPQHVTLQLLERSRVKKLQLLAHHYMIPAKVEFHIGDTLPDSGALGFPGELCRLGYVSLSDNENTSFKARELKSVHVDAIGTYLRVTLHRNHCNRYNHYNQVSLVAINVLGDSLDGNAFNTIPSREQLVEHYLNSTQLEAASDSTFTAKCESISPLDDLAFDMYQDPEVAHIIRILDQKRQEKYEQAKNLKQAIADLHLVGERLARYDVEKRCAIEKEDYDLAKKKKDLMEEYRKSVYQQLEVHNLLDMTMITEAGASSPAHRPAPFLPSPGHGSVSPKPLVSKDTFRMEKAASSHQSHPSVVETVSPRNRSQPNFPHTTAAEPKIDRTNVSSDERPLPALQRKRQPDEAIHSPAEVSSPSSNVQRSPRSPDRSKEPEPLTKKALTEAALPIEVYGENLVAEAYSKTWHRREDALLTVYKKLLAVPPATPKDELRNMIRAAVFLVKKALLDTTPPIVHSSLKLLRLMLSQLIPGLGLGREETVYCLEQTFPNLLARTGDNAISLRATIVAFIQEIAILTGVRALQVIPGELVKPFKFNFPPRLAESRAKIIDKLLTELGTENSGFTLENVMTFCRAALEHSAEPVRKLAVHIVLSMYQQYRSAVLSYLPPNNATTPFLYKTIFDGFAKIDGKLVGTQTVKKVICQQDGQKEEEEVHALREQLAVLKEITERENDSTKGQVAKKESRKAEKDSHKAGKATSNKGPQSKTSNVVDVQQSINSLDNLCIFCGKKDESFTEDGLDLHYWKHCPMLRRCDECRQVVEIASLTEHLLGECENRSRFSQCPRCSEAVAMEDLSSHSQGPTCNPPVSAKGSNHCPLCHSNFTPGEEAGAPLEGPS